MKKKILGLALAASLVFCSFGFASADEGYDYIYSSDAETGESFRFTITQENPVTPTHIFTVGGYNTYCADFFAGIQSGAAYSKTEWDNDSLKAILEFGYKSEWTDADVADLGAAAGAPDLTRAQALTATQIAIWDIIHSDSTIIYYDVDSDTLNSNIEAVRTYLKTKTASSPINFYLIDYKVTDVTQTAEGIYTYKFRFKLNTTPSHNLTINNIPYNEWTTDEEGFYVLSGEAPNIGIEDTWGVKWDTISSTLYKYESLSGSQSLVGYEESTKTSDEAFTFEIDNPTPEPEPEPDKPTPTPEPEPEPDKPTPRPPHYPTPEPEPEPTPTPEPEEPIIEPEPEEPAIDKPEVDIPVSNEVETEVPKTGDPITAYIALAGLSGAGLLVRRRMK